MVKLLLEKKDEFNIEGGPYGNALLATAAALITEDDEYNESEKLKKATRIFKLLLEHGAGLESTNKWADEETRHVYLKHCKPVLEQLA